MPSTMAWFGSLIGPFRARWSWVTSGSADDSDAVVEQRAGECWGTARLAGAEDTVALGSCLGKQLRAGDVVVLSGPLGAGKTVLVKGIAEAMDVEGPVTSPTYVLARVHQPRRPGAPVMIHVDVYRLLDSRGADLLAELDSLDLDTDLDDAVVVVEWGEGLAERLSERHLNIRLELASPSDVRIATWKWGYSCA